MNGNSSQIVETNAVTLNAYAAVMLKTPDYAKPDGDQLLVRDKQTIDSTLTSDLGEKLKQTLGYTAGIAMSLFIGSGVNHWSH